jgi:hypothetical protein
MRSEDFPFRIQSSSVYTLPTPAPRKPARRRNPMSSLKAMIARCITWLLDRLAFRQSKRTSASMIRPRSAPPVRDVQTSHGSYRDEVARFEGEGGTGNAR